MERFIQLFAEAIERNVNEVAKDDNFRNFEEWDSLAVLSVIAMVKKNYDITIPRNEFDALLTIEDLYNRVTKA